MRGSRIDLEDCNPINVSALSVLARKIPKNDTCERMIGPHLLLFMSHFWLVILEGTVEKEATRKCLKIQPSQHRIQAKKKWNIRSIRSDHGRARYHSLEFQKGVLFFINFVRNSINKKKDKGEFLFSFTRMHGLPEFPLICHQSHDLVRLCLSRRSEPVAELRSVVFEIMVLCK